jgi:Tol biopolymer transport system component
VAFLVVCGLAVTAGAQPIRLDVGPGGVPGNASAVLPVVSFDGRYSAFVSAASNLVAGDTDAAVDFFRYDRDTGQLARGDILAAFGVGDYPSLTAISADGRFVAFGSFASDLVTTDTNQSVDVFVRPVR